jgi:hypothetical protein
MFAPDGSADNSCFIQCIRKEGPVYYMPFYVTADGDVSATGALDVTGYESTAIQGITSWESEYAVAIEGRFLGGYNDGTAVKGDAAAYDYYGIGGQFEGGFAGAKGFVEPTGSQTYFGLYGSCDGGSGTNFGVVGDASGTGTNYGVYGGAAGGATNWAGYFDGDVRITGTVVNPAPALEIDHPLDPAGRYLRHPAVHSSEMKNVYDGVVVLDSAGEAWVELPDWFGALNTDFRYQLTAIGAPGPNLYIADEVTANRFRVAGGEPGMKVSWLLTGVRHDAYAEAKGVEVEVRKRADERGMYLAPEAHGASPTLAIGRHVVDTEKLE